MTRGGGVSLSEEQLCRLVPAFLRFDLQERLTGFGPSIEKHFPEFQPGAGFFDLLRITRPAKAEGLAELCARGRSVTVKLVQHEADLNGVIISEPEGFLCLFTHAPTNILTEVGQKLTFQDFSPSDAGVESLTLISMQRALLDEARSVANELAAARDVAVAAGQSKADFLANMSHELRTPLTGIIGYAALLEKEPALPVEAQDYVRRMAGLGRTLLSLVNDILDAEKIEGGRLDLESEPVDLAALAAETLEMVKPQADNRRVRLTFTVDPQLPRKVMSDGGRMRQILLNFLSNAIRFTSHGSVSLKFTAVGDRLRGSVEDSGVGVPSDAVDKLFRRFSQLQAASVAGGTGLGLAICKGLAEAMGGEVGYAPREGGGSVFWFEIPAAPAMANEPPPDEGEFRFTAGKVLVVDDIATNREVLAALLGRRGFDVATAPDGETAVALAEAQVFDVILMDVQMPGLDGLMTTEAIRSASRLNADTPIIGVTADATQRRNEAGLAAGMNAFITKPVDINDLCRKIETLTAPVAALARQEQAGG
jgi:signal transduction histidine kinase/CheY-like chemotaxis protein